MSVSSLTIRALRLRLDGHEPSWAGECPWTDGVCVATEDGLIWLTSLDEREGRLLVSPPDHPSEHRDVQYWDLNRLTAPINAVAFSRKWMGVSTRGEIVLYDRELATEAVVAPGELLIDSETGYLIDGGAHGLVALPGDRFLAPVGPAGMRLIIPQGGEPPTARIGRHDTLGLNFYKLVHLDTSEDSDILVAAARSGGVLGVTLTNEGYHVRFVHHRYPSIDVVDVASLTTPEWPYAVAALDRDGSILLSRNILEDCPHRVRLDHFGDAGTPYAIRRAAGHLLILSSEGLSFVPDLAARFLTGEDAPRVREFQRVELDAVDFAVIHDRVLLVVLPDVVQAIDLRDFQDDRSTKLDGGAYFNLESRSTELIPQPTLWEACSFQDSIASFA